MSKPATYGKLAAIHRKYAEYLESILDEAMAEGDDEHKIPLDAATMGTISKFLKDNEVTADPADKDDLESLREKYTRSSRSKQGQSVASILADASDEDGLPALLN